jgi:hypothetical protein
MTIHEKIAKKADSILSTLVWWCKPVIQKCIKNPVLIFRMDGGTCSQLVDYVSLKMLEDAGYPMRMDITWYDRYGEGDDSVLARPYNIDRLFDLEEYQTAGKWLSWLYQVLFSYVPPKEVMQGGSVDLANFEMPEAPCYLQGYYRYGMTEIEKNWKKYCKLKRAEDILDEKNLAFCREIESCENPIGVHVRRGDMALEGGYWEVFPAQYFINLCEDLNGGRTPRSFSSRRSLSGYRKTLFRT